MVMSRVSGSFGPRPMAVAAATLTADGPQPPTHRNRDGPMGVAQSIRPQATASLSCTFAGCVQAARARDGQVMRVVELTVVVRSVPDLTL
jgi:hypothetical protein